MSDMLFEHLLPASLPALINRIDAPVRGYYTRETPPEAVRRARVAIVDVHWHLTLPGAAKLARELKALNPDIKMIAGGLTASLFARQLVDELGFDYVVRGDGEIPLSQLVATLLDGGDVTAVPNLVGRDDMATPWTYFLTAEDLDADEFYDLDFFPSAKRDIARIHARYAGWASPCFPWLIPFRGCPLPCNGCTGSTLLQPNTFRRSFVVRSPERLVDDLQRLERDPHIAFVNSLLDFVTLTSPEYAQTVLQRPVRLGLFQEFSRPPKPEWLDLLLARFDGGVVKICADYEHLTGDRFAEPALLVDLIRRVQRKKNYIAVLNYNRIHACANADYRAAVAAVHKQTRCLLIDESHWWSDAPQADENGDGNRQQFPVLLTTRRNRFATLKVAFRLMTLADTVLPQAARLLLRKIYYRLVQTPLFYLSCRNKTLPKRSDADI